MAYLALGLFGHELSLNFNHVPDQQEYVDNTGADLSFGFGPRPHEETCRADDHRQARTSPRR